MMRKKILRLFLCTAFAADCFCGFSQQKIGNLGEFDKTVHDFGDISTGDGPVSCEFIFTNTSSSPVTILNVLSSCGCTDVEWTRDPIAPGKKGKVSATYKNEDGENTFSKALTCYILNVKQPVLLKLRGTVHEKVAPLKDLYTIHFGNLAFKEVDIQGGNLTQGGQRSGQFNIANIGNEELNVSFVKVSEFLSIKVSPNPIPPNSIASLSYTITADRSLWGKNYYYATPLVNGRGATATGKPNTGKKASGAEVIQADRNERLGAGKNEIGFWCFTRENFDKLSKEQKAAGANPYFESSNSSFGKVKEGKRVKVTFNCKNIGKSDLVFFSADCDSKKAEVTLPATIKPGKQESISVDIDTSLFPKGEVMVLITLTTNAPLRPLVNLFATGFIE